MINISKSKYMSFIVCPKKFWLKFNEPELTAAENANTKLRFHQGHEVGKVALALFPGIVNAQLMKEDNTLDMGAMCKKTKALIEDNCPAIAEAAFSGEGAYCAVDVLKNNGDGTWDLYEVKSAVSCKDYYLPDIAFQRYVLTCCGIKVKQSNVIYINREYVRNGDIEPDKLFIIEEVSERLNEFTEEIPEQLKQAHALYESETEPSIDISKGCGDCEFWCHCSRHLPKNNIFSLYNLWYKFDHYKKGIISFEDILKSDIKLDEIQQRQIDFELNDIPPHIDKPKIREFLEQINFPIYFLDFETINPCLPSHDGIRPYQKVPFQYSLHILKSKNEELEHKEFLADENKNEYRALAEQLIKDIPADGGSIIGYNAGFEKGVITKMAAIFPNLEDRLNYMRSRIVDLYQVFRKGYFHNKAMDNFSLKSILPALFPDNPDLDYSANEDVHDGMEASAAFLYLKDQPPQERERIRTNLLKYCRLDTFAMVSIYQKLCLQTEENNSSPTKAETTEETNFNIIKQKTEKTK